MMMKREQLRTDPLVESALMHMWARFDKVRGGEEAISQQTYTAMCRKLYLLFKIQQRDGYLEPADALSEIVRDWPHDTGGKDHMNRHDFDSAWFQLADIHTDDVAVASYCALLHTACDAIMTPDGECRVRLVVAWSSCSRVQLYTGYRMNGSLWTKYLIKSCLTCDLCSSCAPNHK